MLRSGDFVRIDGDNFVGQVGPIALAQIRSVIGDLLEIG